MKNKIVIFLFFNFLLLNLCWSRTIERLVLIKLMHHDDVYRLNEFDLTIIDAGKDYAKALVDDKKITELKNAGYKVDILIEDYKKYKDEIFERGFYHTYNQVYLVLDSFVTLYPNICHLDTIGLSSQGRAIWAMRVTDNPTIEENEPEIRLAGNIHGDEHIGTEITLYFLRYLLTNYATNPQVQNLVNNREIWILPVLNPDGKVANTRYNANGVDLNRDYGYFWGGDGGSPGPLSQTENQHFMYHLLQNNISLEYNYHSAAQYVNYLWDYHPSDPSDSMHIINLSGIYGDSANLTPINGYDWYQVRGSLQDYTYGTSGALAWTIETLEPSQSSQIDQICYDNRDALMDLCNRAGWGIEGVVKDSNTNLPLYARVEIPDSNRACIYTDPTIGDFHKMVQGQRTYTVRISANGYYPKTIQNVVVPPTGSVNLGEIRLAPNPNWLYAFRVVLCRYAQHAQQLNKTQPRYALGSEDNIFFSLGQSGYIVLDMGQSTPIANISGNDFTVFEGDDGVVEGYTVYASNHWNGPWYNCGTGNGTQSFDLAAAGLSVARYIRIVDDGSATSGPYAGFDLDAIKSFSTVGIGEVQNPGCECFNPKCDIYPNPFRNHLVIKFQIPKTKSQNSNENLAVLRIYDAAGRLVKDFSRLTVDGERSTVIWDGCDDLGRELPGGVYFVRLEAGDFKQVEKAVLLR
ncbi:MAG: M14 family zinc carboxypeptidase [candidate division WOR-3 bacterium]